MFELQLPYIDKYVDNSIAKATIYQLTKRIKLLQIYPASYIFIFNDFARLFQFINPRTSKHANLTRTRPW